jgi:2-dehydropantoate 2-reductase
VKAIVVGCGAVGTVLAVALSLGGAEVVVASRRASGCSQRRAEARGLGSSMVSVCGWAHLPKEVDVMVFATKAYDLPSAVNAAKDLGLRPRLAVSVQNGLGSLELVEEAFDSAAGMIIYFGSTGLSECSALYTGGRRVVAGCRRSCDEDALRELLDAIASAGLSPEKVSRDEFEGERWLKLATNAAINPLTLIAWSRNGEIVRDERLRALASALADEVGRVARGLGIRLPEDPVEAALRTASDTSANCSSSVQDVAAGRRTELRYINGAVWEASLKLNFRASLNLFAYLAGEAASEWLKGRRSPCEG